MARATDLVGPLVRHAFDCFGADRVLWGSNYPIDKPVLALPDAVGVLRDALGAELPAVESRLFGANAVRVYRLANTTQT